jgi:glyoxylate reductase
MGENPKVYVTRIIPEAGLAMVRDFCETEVWEEDIPVPREILLEKVRDKVGLLPLLTERVDAELMDAAPGLRIISNYAVGYDNVDVAEATARGILVGNTPGVLTETTADMAFGLLLAAARRLVEGARYVHQGRWKTWGPQLLLGYDVHGATLGIVGLGRIGRAVARRAVGFGMRIQYHDQVRQEDLEHELGLEYVDLPTLLRQADFVSLHVPLTPVTRYLIGPEELRQMKTSAVLINTARGPIVDAKALYEALHQGEIAYAALDVTDPEPILPEDPLLTLDNVIIVPHLGSASVATRRRMAEMAAENLIAGLKGERPPHLVNPEVLPVLGANPFLRSPS